MIETVLAVAIVTMGILSIFLLFSSGLDLNTPSIADTRVAIFGDNVLNGLRAESEHAASTTGWLEFWEDFETTDISITVAATDIWTNSPVILGDNELHTNIYTVNPLRTNSTITGLVEQELRYKLKVEFKTNPPDYETNNVAVTLKVWPGSEGSTNDTDALILYTWFHDHGDL